MEKIDLIKGGQNPGGQTYPYPASDNRAVWAIRADLADQDQARNVSTHSIREISSKPRKFRSARPILISRHINRKTGHAPLLTRSRVPRGNTGSRDSRTIVPFSASACRYPAIRISNLPRR